MDFLLSYGVCQPDISRTPGLLKRRVGEITFDQLCEHCAENRIKILTSRLDDQRKLKAELLKKNLRGGLSGADEESSRCVHDLRRHGLQIIFPHEPKRTRSPSSGFTPVSQDWITVRSSLSASISTS